MSPEAGPGSPSATRTAAHLLTTGYRRTECLAAAVGLGVFDRLQSGGATAADLAQATGAKVHHLRRLLRALVAMEALIEEADGSFRTTELGSMFTSHELGPAVRLFASQVQWRAWSRLEDAVRTGERAFDLEHGVRDWDFYARNPDMGAMFDAGMRSFTGSSAAAIVAAHDFGGYGSVADIGGGDGTLLAAILTANPGVSGILFDRPAVVERAARRLSEANLSARCRTVAGDFLETVPSGADAYVLKWILHDWEDPDAKRILLNCRRAMTDGSHLIVIERVIPDHVGAKDLEATMADLQMMVMNGGVERTETEFRDLLRDSGFGVVSITSTGTPVSVIHGVA